MKSGKCPKCSSTEIYTNNERSIRGHHCIIDTGVIMPIRSDTYLCGQCGFIEDYLPKDRIDKLKSKWTSLKV